MDRISFVFLPGFMCDGRLFSAQIEVLSALGHTCIVADLTRSTSITGLAQSVLHEAPERFVPVGLSMGGIVALELYAQAPQRISHLALFNTTFRADRAGEQRLAQLDRVRRGELDLVLRDELKPTYMHPANRSPQTLDLLADMAAGLGEAVFERQTRALMTRASQTAILPTIARPALVLTGDSDALCPPDLHRKMASAIPAARLKIAARCGHLSTLERADIVTAALCDLIGQPPFNSPPDNPPTPSQRHINASA